MRIKAFKQLGDTKPIIANVGMVVIERDDGTPIGVACEDGSGFIHISHAGDKDEFSMMLRNLGVDQLVIVESLDQLLTTGVRDGRPPSARMPLLMDL